MVPLVVLLLAVTAMVGGNVTALDEPSKGLEEASSTDIEIQESSSATSWGLPDSSSGLLSEIRIPGSSRDRFCPFEGNGANLNRLGMGSDAVYDPVRRVFYSLADRGPGGGVIDFKTRVHEFRFKFDPITGALVKMELLRTIGFRLKNGEAFNGLNPERLNKNNSMLGMSLDPEGITLIPGGNFFVADEYGPSVYEFDNFGVLVRKFEPPSNLLPKKNGQLLYVGRPETGRQENRGYEGLTINKAATKLYAILQDPLEEEGKDEETGKTNGRCGQYLRIVRYDIASGKSDAQYFYKLADLSVINEGLADKEKFTPCQLGRNIGVSAILSISEDEFLVLERDNRGYGVEDPLGKLPVAHKVIYKINISGATDVSSISLKGTNTLPSGVEAVTKTLYLDIKKALKQAGKKIFEKHEAIVFGPELSNGNKPLVIQTDNDFGVTQTEAEEQLDVCTNLVDVTSQVKIDQPCPRGEGLIPSITLSFKP